MDCTLLIRNLKTHLNFSLIQRVFYNHINNLKTQIIIIKLFIFYSN